MSINRSADPPSAADCLHEELESIRARRSLVLVNESARPKAAANDAGADNARPVKDDDRRLTDARNDALREHLVGLAFSGGGIRSGTFAVGFLQGLGSLRLVRRIDYLSTVSGGGYAGGWLASWIAREASIENVEHQLDMSRAEQAQAERGGLIDRRQVVDEEPEPIRHLRAYSSYMAPRIGLLTLDVWTIAAIWLRNVAINLMMIFPRTMCLVLGVRLVVLLFATMQPDLLREGAYVSDYRVICGILIVLGLIALIVAFLQNARALGEFRDGARDKWLVTHPFFALVVPAGVAAILLTLSVPPALLVISDWVQGVATSATPRSALARSLLLWVNEHAGLIGFPNVVLLHVIPFGTIMAFIAATANLMTDKSYKRWRYFGASLVVAGAVVLGLGSLSIGWQPRWGTVAAIAGEVLIVAGAIHLIAAGFGHVWAPGKLAERPGPSLLLALFGLAILAFCILHAFALSWAEKDPLWLIAVPVLLFAVGMIVLLRGMESMRYAGSAFLAGGSGGLLFAILEAIIAYFSHAKRADVVALVAVPGALTVLIAAIVVQVGVIGHAIRESEREWWASLAARFGLTATAWLLVFGIVLYVPAGLLAANVPIRLALGSTWLLTTLGGIIAGRARSASGTAGGLLPIIARFVPPIFVIGLLGALGLLVSYLAHDESEVLDMFATNVGALERVNRYFHGINNTSAYILLLFLLLMFILYKIASGWIDVNLFSLNAMYHNRLVRCYLGATRAKPEWPKRWGVERERHIFTGAATNVPRPNGNPVDRIDDPEAGLKPFYRDPNPVTGFDPKDDIPLGALWTEPSAQLQSRPYQGPLLLINATLNLVAGRELSWRDRKGESFVLSARYCGSKGTGYALLPHALKDMRRQNLTLGRAMAISGAAVDPNMNYLQTPMLTAFLTVFNARLGYWIKNPRLENWGAEGPELGGTLLWDEMLGRTTEERDFIHLSDGGHFDNLGIYELVRRRCRYIIAVDAGEDADASNDNLATMIRLVRIDVGVRIQIDTGRFRPQGSDRLTSTHVVIGQVRYDDVDSGQQPGVLIYVKISLTGDEPPDLQKYARKHADFPHEATDYRQSFDEEQFESYRDLGDHIARTVFEGPAAEVVLAKCNSLEEVRYTNRKFFDAVRRHWTVPPIGQDENYLKTTAAWTGLQRDLRARPELARLAHEIYPEMTAAPSGRPSAEALRAEVHTVGQMMQVLEDTWIALGLSMRARSDLPMNQGWLNVFHRWGSSPTFRRYWAVYRSEFSPDFVRFCEQAIHLGPNVRRRIACDLTLVRTQVGRSALHLLDREFAHEWPEEATARRSIRHFWYRASEARLPAWLIVQAPFGTPDPLTLASPGCFPSGLILVVEEHDQNGQPVADKFELFVWMRPAHRSIGLGSILAPEALADLESDLKDRCGGREFTVKARYPKGGAAAKIDPCHAQWIRFLGSYDFRPLESRDEATVLQWDRRS